MKRILIIFVVLFGSLFANMPEPYASINVLPFDPHGWFGNAQFLDEIFRKKEIKIVIEVGSWLGCSTRHLANILPDEGVLYAVDTWLGSPEEAYHMRDPRLPYLYQQFLSNVIHANLTQKIVPIRMKSIEAARAINIKADLIYLDAAHDTNSVLQDIAIWYPHLKKDGVMCGDDWSWDTVRVAVIQQSKLLGKKVNHIGNFWWYE